MSDTKKIVFETEWFTVEEEYFNHIESLSGKPYYRITQPDSVVILALTDNNEIVLIKQFRPALDITTLEIPSGNIDDNETPEEAVARELYEETGYRCTSIKSLGMGSVLVNRLKTGIFTFLGTGAVKDPQFQPGDDIQVVLSTPEELKERVVSGHFDNLAMLSLLVLADWKHGTNLVK